MVVAKGRECEAAEAPDLATEVRHLSRQNEAISGVGSRSNAAAILGRAPCSLTAVDGAARRFTGRLSPGGRLACIPTARRTDQESTKLFLTPSRAFRTAEQQGIRFRSIAEGSKFSLGLSTTISNELQTYK